MFSRAFLSASLAAAFCFAFLPGAKADQWDKRSVLTFDQPVEVPGMVLAPGTYTFKLMDSDSDRNIVQIFNRDETRLYTTILAIPGYRLNPADSTVVTLEERARGAPEAILDWFYPGQNYGEEFVYPAARAARPATSETH